MIDWNETHLAIRDAIRKFVEAEIKPQRDALEREEVLPYPVLRKFYETFGVADMSRARGEIEVKRAKKREDALARGEALAPRPKREGANPEAASEMAMRMIPIIEFSKYCPGLITALGVSAGLAANAIIARGTSRQIEQYAIPLLTFEKIGAWAITEPGSGSDAFGSMKSTARRDGDGYVLNGNKTFITNGPYADLTVFICKLDEGNDPRDRKIVSFILDKGMPGFVQSKPLRKMGQHTSPTGELFLEDVRVGRDRLIGESESPPARENAKDSAKDTFTAERTLVAAMALGIVEQCLKLCTEYAKTRVQFGRPIGEFQLIQLKLAKMEVARMNIQNLIFRQIEMAGEGMTMDIAEASACKLYCAQATMDVTLEAVQLFGGNGYMSEFQVEQLCRDAKVLQIYGGTDEIQISQIARRLLARE